MHQIQVFVTSLLSMVISAFFGLLIFALMVGICLEALKRLFFGGHK